MNRILIVLLMLFFSNSLGLYSQNNPLQLGEIKPNWHSAQWILEPVEPNQPNIVRIKNFYKQEYYLHNELENSIGFGKIEPEWQSARWVLEPVESNKPNIVRIKNFKTGKHLHNERGILEIGEIEPAWWSARWVLERVESNKPNLVRIKNFNQYEYYLHNETYGFKIKEGSKIAFKSDRGGWISVCSNCNDIGTPNLPYLVTNQSVGTTPNRNAIFTVEYQDGTMRFKSWNGSYVFNCKGCLNGADDMAAINMVILKGRVISQALFKVIQNGDKYQIVSNTQKKWGRFKPKRLSSFLPTPNDLITGMSSPNDDQEAAKFDIYIQNKQDGKFYPAFVSPSTHMRSSFNHPPAQDTRGYKALEINIKVEREAPSHFWSNGFTFKSNEYGYFGFQSKPEGKIVIFSIWKAQEGRGASNGKVTSFGHEGSGITCDIPYNWQTGREYKFRLEFSGSEGQYNWWELKVTDILTGDETFVGKIKTLASWNWLKNASGFVEYFDKQDTQLYPCTEIGYTKTIFRTPVMFNANNTPTGVSDYKIDSVGFCRPYVQVNRLNRNTYIVETGKIPNN